MPTTLQSELFTVGPRWRAKIQTTCGHRLLTWTAGTWPSLGADPAAQPGWQAPAERHVDPRICTTVEACEQHADGKQGIWEDRQSVSDWWGMAWQPTKTAWRKYRRRDELWSHFLLTLTRNVRANILGMYSYSTFQPYGVLQNWTLNSDIYLIQQIKTSFIF